MTARAGERDRRSRAAFVGSAVFWGLVAAGLAAAFVPQRRIRTATGTPATGDGADLPPVPDDGRGRAATSPVDIPRRGWWDILVRTVTETIADRVLSLAAGVAFYGLLAVFPAISALISLYGLVLDPTGLQQQLDAASWFLPSGAIEVMRDQALRIISKGAPTLGFSFLLSLGIALWSANAATKAMIEALNIAYEEEERRSFVRLTLITLSFTLAAILFAGVATAVVIALPVAFKLMSIDSGTEWLISLLRWPALATVVALVISVIYRFGPCRQAARWAWVSLGSVVAALLWIAVSVGFSWYVSRFGNYNETYGSLGAVVGFMTWMWLSITVVLVGAELNAEMEHQTAMDTTTGPPQPMGQRGARMADTIGPAQ